APEDVAHGADDVRLRLPQLGEAGAGRIVEILEPGAHGVELALDPARERHGLLGRPADEAGRARDPVREHEGAEPARLGRGPRAAWRVRIDSGSLRRGHLRVSTGGA